MENSHVSKYLNNLINRNVQLVTESLSSSLTSSVPVLG